MADPEGGEFCALPARARPSCRRTASTGSASTASTRGRRPSWWGERRSGSRSGGGRQDWFTLEHATPDPVLTLRLRSRCRRLGSAPNRVHWDVTGDVDALLAAGATHLLGTCRHWTVLADPEGNEFCVFVSRLPLRG